MNISHLPLTCIESLTEAELFVVCAARVYREMREHPARHCTCLPRIFSAAQLSSALPKFLEMQIALSADSQQTIAYEERSTQRVGSGELVLLQALSTWQHHPAKDPTNVLWFVRVRAIRRVASNAGRAFALEMAAAGLVLPELRLNPPATQPLTVEAARAQGAKHVH